MLKAALLPSAKWMCAAGGILYLLIMTFSVAAQLPTATILGSAKDASGAVIPGVSLTAKNTDTGLTRTTTTVENGSYRFSALPVGSYEIRAEHPGFQAEVRSGLTLAVSEEAVVNFMLQVGAVEQTVAVTADAPLVNTTTGSLGGLVDERKVADLPLNGRNFMDLTLMQTGIAQHKDMSNSASTVGLWFSSNGAPLRSNNYMLDGAIMTNNTGATSASSDGSTLGIEGIREYRVITNSFSAEYGMTMGSQVVLVSKSGTNGFHGSAFEFLRNNVLDARNIFDYPSAATKRGFRLPAYRRNQFGASGGGPLRKDKTFFFAAYEGLRERLGTTNIDNVMAAGCHGNGGTTVTNTACPQLGSTPSATIAPQIAPLLALIPNPNLPPVNGVPQYTFPYSQPTREDFGQIRVDQVFSGDDTLFARYTIDDTEQVNPTAYPVYNQIRGSRSQFATFSESHIFSAALLNTARISFSRTDPTVLSSNNLIGPQYSYLPGAPMGTLGISGVTSLTPPSKSVQKRNIFSLSDDAFYTWSRHSLKFGTLMNRFLSYSSVNTQALGSISFTNVTNFLQGLVNNYSANTPGSVLDRTYLYDTFGFYAQDDFRILPRLSLNLGLRYEFMTQMNETKGHGSALRDVQHDAAPTLGSPFRNMSLRNWSPRFGFAWDVNGNGKTALRGGFAELYDIGVFGQALAIGVTGTPPFSSVSSVPTPSTLALPLFFPANSVGKSLRTVDYRMQQPHILDYNLSLERQLPGKVALAVAYAGSRGINIVQTVDGNPTVPQILPGGQQFWTGTDPRTNPNWAGMEFKTAGGNSWYNSLQFGLLKQMSHGLQFQSSYTWAKIIDETQGQAGADNAASNIFGTDPSRRQVDRAVADFDITQNWRFNAIYQLPQMVQASKLLGAVLNGWRLSSIVSVQTGYPFSPTLNSNRSRSVVNTGGGGIDRPDLLAGRNNRNIVQGTSTCTGSRAGRKLGTPTLYYDPCAFAVEPIGFLGNAGRNILRGPGLTNLDFSMVKETALPRLGESGRLEFRAELFNILNHPNFGIPNRTVFAGTQSGETPLSTAGLITNTSTDPRRIQLALKILF